MEGKMLEQMQQQTLTEDDVDIFDLLQQKHQAQGPRSKAEVEADIEYFVNHPLNCKKLTPEMLDMPEY